MNVFSLPWHAQPVSEAVPVHIETQAHGIVLLKVSLDTTEHFSSAAPLDVWSPSQIENVNPQRIKPTNKNGPGPSPGPGPGPGLALAVSSSCPGRGFGPDFSFAFGAGPGCL